MSVSIDLGVAGLSQGTEIGRGGFGVVYRAEQLNFGRAVAVKVLSPMTLSEDVSRRFQQECKAMAQVSSHPNIVALYDSGVTADGTRSYLIMELVPGGSLTANMPVPWERAVEIGVKLSGALETAHRIGIFHRDVKPENILLSAYGEPKLTDFGIAKIAGSTETVSGHITASILHASPEVLSGARPSVQTDIYSLASTIYALIHGQAAFASDEEEETLAPLLLRISIADPPDLRPAGVPDEICRVLESGMAKSAAERPTTAAEFGRQLAEAQRAVGLPVTQMLVEGEVPEQRPVRPAGGRAPATNITPKPIDSAEDEPRAGGSRRRLAAALAAVVVVAGGVTAVALSGGPSAKGGTGGGNHPIVPVTYTVAPSCVGLDCTLTATGSAPSTSKLQWTFGDGSPTVISNGLKEPHAYRKAGTYDGRVGAVGGTAAQMSTFSVTITSASRSVRAATRGQKLKITVSSATTDCMKGGVDLQEKVSGTWFSGPATASGAPGSGTSSHPAVGAEHLVLHGSITTGTLPPGIYRAMLPQSRIAGGVCAPATSKPVRVKATSTTTPTGPTTNPTNTSSVTPVKTSQPCNGPCHNGPA